MSKRTIAVLTACRRRAATFAALAATAWADDPLPRAITHEHWNGYEALAEEHRRRRPASSQYKNPSSPICSTDDVVGRERRDRLRGSRAAQRDVDRDQPDEPEQHDRERERLPARERRQERDDLLARARHVRRGKTWTTYPINFNGYIATGDPAVAFDATGQRVSSRRSASASARARRPARTPTSSSRRRPTAARRGRRRRASRAAAAPSAASASSTTRSTSPPGATETRSSPGRASTTSTRARTAARRSTRRSRTTAARRGRSGVEISGAASFCASFTAGCDQNQNSTPVVAADGSIYVSFLTTRDNSNGRDAYAVVQVDPQTGQRIAGPFKVADLFDGVGDYPVSAFGDTTYQDSVFRTWSAGNLTADPTNAQHLAVSWSDMRNSTLTSTDPYATKTNSDVGVAESFDGGRTWTTKIFTVRERPVLPVGCLRRHGQAARRLHGPLVRRRQPQVRLHPGDGDEPRLADVRDAAGHDRSLRPDAGRPLVLRDHRSIRRSRTRRRSSATTTASPPARTASRPPGPTFGPR